MNNQNDFSRYNSITGFAHMLLLVIVIVAVGAGGWWMWKNDKLNVAVEGPTTTPTPTKTTEKIPDNWKTYQNNNLSFKFGYPNDLVINDESDNANPDRDFYYLHIGFIPRGSDPTSYNLVYLQAMDKYDSLEEFLNNQWCDTQTNMSAAIVNTYNYKNLVAKEVRCEGRLSSKNLIFKKEKFIYHFSVNYGEAHSAYYTKEETEKLFNQILSTFEFTE